MVMKHGEEESIAGQTADGELIRAYLAGDAGAFDVLYERYRRPLYSYLNRVLTDRSTADDAFQQTWLKAIRNFPSYRNEQKFFSWISVIAHNLVMDRFRREKTAGEESIDEEGLSETLVHGGPEPWEEMSAEEFSEAFEKALAELPPDQRDVVALRRAGISFREIAELRKCPINTALGRMNYAMKNLRKSLSAWR